MDILDHSLDIGAAAARHQDGEFVAADAGGAIGRRHGFAQHLAEAAQQAVAGIVAKLIVGILEAVEIDDDD